MWPTCFFFFLKSTVETPDEFVELGGMELLAKVLANYHSITDKEEQHRLLGHSLYIALISLH